MNDHDRDLILDLTEGTLSAQDAERARAQVASNAELAAAYELQMAAKNELDTLAPVTMATEERSALRATLIDELHLESAVAPAPAVAPRRGFAWWKPVAGIASVAAVVAAIVVLPGSLGGSDDAGDTALGTETSVAVDVASEESSDGAASSPGAGAAEEGPAVAEVPQFNSLDGADVLDATEDATSPAEIADSVSALGPQSRATIDVASLEACLERLADQLPSGTVAPVAFEKRDGADLLFLTVTSGDDVGSVVTIDLTACSLVDTDQ